MQVIPSQVLPLSPANLGTEHGPAQGKPIIAVVDDDPSILRALARLIRSRGGVAQVFNSPFEFIEASGHSAPDCLIVDVQMPGMGGLELYLRLLARGFNFPVIFITAHEDPEAEDKAASAGAAGFLYKPFHNDKLWETVQRALSASGAK